MSFSLFTTFLLNVGMEYVQGSVTVFTWGIEYVQGSVTVFTWGIGSRKKDIYKSDIRIMMLLNIMHLLWSKISGFHSGEYEDDCLLGRYAG
jgi:hypothetical protein